MKAVISIMLSQRQRRICDQGGCWLWQGKWAKISIFFSKQHFAAGLSL